MVVRVVMTYGVYMLVYVDNSFVYSTSDSAIAAGQPGVGVRGAPSGNSISLTQLGPRYTGAPSAVPQSAIALSTFPDRVDMQWAGSTEPDGPGVFDYHFSRSGNFLGATANTAITDGTVSANTSYSYTLQACDWHWNCGNTTFTATTPPSGQVDPRRSGVRANGNYWGGMGENVDLLSGNLNFMLPLLKAQGRGGWKVGVNLAYNSQNWRQDGAVNWNLGRDVGYGYGWKLLVGSLLPVITPYVGVHHYVFTDSSGAEYKLTQNGGGVWTSSASVYVNYDSNANRLYFNDGSFWVMGSTAAGTEEDSGTMYPTVMQDSNGNQVVIEYAAGLGVTWSNSSARILTIRDTRSKLGNAIYTFTYNADAIPHLTSITNSVGTAEGYTFSYSNNALTSPWGGTFGYSGILNSVTVSGVGLSYQFVTGSTGELTNVVFPYGGGIGWAYQDATYPGSRKLREVYWRSLNMGGTRPQRYFGFARDGAPNPVHSWAAVDDNTGNGEKVYWFSTSGSTIGLPTAHEKRTLPGPVTRMRDEYSWTQSTSGNWYIQTVTNKLFEPGSSTAVQKTSSQTLDAYGNITQSVQTDWGGGASRTYNNTYVTSSAYVSRYIRNRLVSSTLSPYGVSGLTLVTNTYDSYGCAGVYGLSDLPSALEHDSNYGTSFVTRGNVTARDDQSGHSCAAYDVGGNVIKSMAPNGTVTESGLTGSSNWSAPSTITVGSLAETLSWTSFLGLQSAQGPNGDTVSTVYDSYARPGQTTSSTGVVTTYSYATSSPWTTTAVTGPQNAQRWTRTTVDGFGRPVKVESGTGPTSSAASSVTETTYDACGCNPIGKTTSVSMPRLPNDSAVWTSYSFDGLGRTLSVTAPGSAAKTYAYSYNTVTVTDEAGKWKQYWMDGFGNVTQVREPDPASPGTSSYYTYYTYDVLNHLTGVNMPRPSGTQTRTFNYSGPYLMSAQNPENGTVTYTYGTGGLLASKTDAKGQQVQYSYDSYGRLSQVRHYALNLQGTLVEDTCQQVNLTYDSNGVSGFTSLAGRVATRTYSVCENPNGTTTLRTDFTDMFGYTAAGQVTKKRLRVARTLYQNGTPVTVYRDLDGSWTYTEEKMTRVTYPSGSGGPAAPSYTFGYDSMARLNTMTDSSQSQLVTGVTYGAAGEITGIAGQYTESRGYNSRLQLTSMNGVQFTYGSGNNGKIASQYDPVGGETLTYAYDALNRLISATSSKGWGQSFGYDGFGNLTDKDGVTGYPTVPSSLHIGFDPHTNHQNGMSYDANGNQLTSPTNAGLQYDIENRVSWAGTNGYGYDPDNRRVYKSAWTYDPETGSTLTGETVDYFGVGGQKMGSYTLTTSGSGLSLVATGYNVYFGARLVLKTEQGIVRADRLGSFGKYYPYGEERDPSGLDGTEKFATYFRDSGTGLDYAVNRYYSAGLGRFTSADPYMNGAMPSDPTSWNRYSYTGGDPINRADPGGLAWICFGDSVDGLSLNCTGHFRNSFISLTDWDDIHGNSQRVDNPCGTGPMLLPNPWCMAPVVALVPPSPPGPTQVFAGLALVGDCYDRSAGAFGQAGGAAVRRLTYMPVDETGAPYLGTVTVNEQNTVTEGTQTSINTSWTVSGGGTFNDYISAGGGQAVFQEQQQFFASGSTSALQINWFLGYQFKQLGVYAIAQSVKINNTYPVNKDGTPHYCDQPDNLQVK